MTKRKDYKSEAKELKAELKALRKDLADAGRKQNYNAMRGEIEAVCKEAIQDLNEQQMDSLIDHCFQLLDNNLSDWVEDWKENNLDSCDDCDEYVTKTKDCRMCGNAVCENCRDDHRMNCDMFE